MSKMWVYKESAGKSMGALVIIVQEAVPRVFGNCVDNTAEVLLVDILAI
jgi:hypothetical protein